MKANASKRKIFDAVDMLTENTSAKTTEVKAENGVEQIAIDSIKAFTCKPIIVYPNGGAQYDALSKTWSNHAKNTSYGTMAQRWHEKGARIIGGCCQTTPEDIQEIAKWVRPEIKGVV